MKVKIELGDYLELGTYRNKRILWRCVAFHKAVKDPAGSADRIEKNGYLSADLTKCMDDSKNYKDGYLPLLLSDESLCFKVFDAPGSDERGSHARGDSDPVFGRRRFGSPFWGDSNIRCWLNSAAEAGKVEWICGNPPTSERVTDWNDAYDQEAGFLNAFHEEEINVIKPVTQYTIIHLTDYPDMTEYTQTIKYETRGINIRAAAESMLRGDSDDSIDVLCFFSPEDLDDMCDPKAWEKEEETMQCFTDRVFLLDKGQLQTVINNAEILGSDYCRAKYKGRGDDDPETFANQYALESSKMDGDFARYWLRDSYKLRDLREYENSDVNTKVCTFNEDIVEIGPCANGIGVRPAFYLDVDKLGNITGDGSKDNPYRIMR